VDQLVAFVSYSAILAIVDLAQHVVLVTIWLMV
jgi:hypothetical protein